MAFSVRREDLRTSSSPSFASGASSPPHSPLLLAHLQSLYAGSVEHPGPPTPALPKEASPPTASPAQGTSPAPQTYAFRLFAAPSASAPALIRLASPSPENPEPGFLPPCQRPRSYYFAGLTDADARAEYEATAITGADVKRGSRDACPGYAMPWRVTQVVLPRGPKGKGAGHRVASAGLGGGEGSGDVPRDERAKRKKPGKKRRIVLRVRARRVEAARQEARAKARKRQEATAAARKDREGPQTADKRLRKNQARKERRRAIKQAKTPNGEESSVIVRKGPAFEH